MSRDIEPTIREITCANKIASSDIYASEISALTNQQLHYIIRSHWQ